METAATEDANSGPRMMSAPSAMASRAAVAAVAGLPAVSFGISRMLGSSNSNSASCAASIIALPTGAAWPLIGTRIATRTGSAADRWRGFRKPVVSRAGPSCGGGVTFTCGGGVCVGGVLSAPSVVEQAASIRPVISAAAPSFRCRPMREQVAAVDTAVMFRDLSKLSLSRLSLQAGAGGLHPELPHHTGDGKQSYIAPARLRTGVLRPAPASPIGQYGIRTTASPGIGRKQGVRQPPALAPGSGSAHCRNADRQRAGCEPAPARRLCVG